MVAYVEAPGLGIRASEFSRSEDDELKFFKTMSIDVVFPFKATTFRVN
jgi:hypothetical protein